MKYYIEEDLGISYQDSGPWRSYSISAGGDNIDELMEDVTISETDQNGGELDCYGLDAASNDVYEIVVDLLNKLVVQKEVQG